MTAFEVLMPAEGMPVISERIEQRATLHRLWQAPDREAALAELAPRIRA
ncbi:MAG: 2-hydroxyacid dehydrogenase, partial [Hyphomicrobiales bacterium]|nr:2-hydroxyacid dehydrogenase [Hyphomicrobiales bacterium]